MPTALPTLTLDDAVKRALDNNSDLRQAALTLNQSRRANSDWVNQFLTVQDPSLSISKTDQLYPSGETSDWAWGSLNFGIKLALAGDGFAQRRLAASQYQAALQTYDTKKMTLVTNVSMSFYTLLSSRTNVDILRRDVEVKKSRYEKAQANYGQGLASELDMLTAEYAFRTSGPALDAAVTAYNENLSAFCLLIGMDAAAAPLLQGEIVVRPLSLPAPQELAAKYVNERADVRQQKLALEQKRITKEIGIYKGTPALGLADTITLAPESGKFPDLGDPKLSNSFSVTLSLPVSSWIPGLKDSVTRGNNTDALESARLAYDAAVKSAEQDIRKNVNAVTQAAKDVETAELSGSVAQKKYELSEQGYNGGLVSLDALQDADSDLLTSRQAALKAKVAYLQAVYNLAAALGMDTLTLFEQWGK